MSCEAASQVLGIIEDVQGWSGYLWENGRERDLIHLLDDGEGQGYAAWRVLPALDNWQELIQNGLQSRQIDF